MTNSRPRLRESAPASAKESETPHEAHELSTTAEETASLRLWVILSRAHAAIAEHASADVARHGLTLAEFAILEALYHRGPMLLGEVQRRILVSSGGITFLVDRLTAKGLVERRNCASDRRARYAALTPKGDALVGEIFPAHAAALTRAMGGLDMSELAQSAEQMKTLGRFAADLPLATADEEEQAASA